MSASPEGACAFVADYHRDLTDWFSGSGPKQAIWKRLEDGLHPQMRITFPDGTLLDRDALLATLASRYGGSPGFVAAVSRVRAIVSAADHVVVAYVETQTAATSSAARNARSSLAVVVPTPAGWTWRIIQETAIPGT